MGQALIFFLNLTETVMLMCLLNDYVSELSSCESERHSAVSESLLPQGLYSPWNSPGQNTEVGSLSLLQQIFPTQGSKPGLLCLLRWQLGSLTRVPPGEPSCPLITSQLDQNIAHIQK